MTDYKEQIEVNELSIQIFKNLKAAAYDALTITSPSLHLDDQMTEHLRSVLGFAVFSLARAQRRHEFLKAKEKYDE